MLPLLSAYENHHSCSPKSTNLMVFELSHGRHYPEYLAHLVRYWCEQKYQGGLFMVVSPQFLQRHQDVANLPDNHNRDNVKFIAIAAQEEAGLKSPNSSFNSAWRTFAEFELAKKYAQKLKVDRVFFPYLDTRQLPLALGKKFPCPFSGIYFRPRFHYHQFLHHNGNFSQKIEELPEKLILQRTLAHPQLKTLFSLDPFFVQYLNRVQSATKIVHLSDPVEIENQSATPSRELKDSLGIESGRLVLLVFGSLTPRKGILQILEALSLVSHQLCGHLCLLLVGSIAAPFQSKLDRALDKVQKSLPIQIITHYHYVAQAEIQNYFQLADVVLTLYQGHVGMSGILVRAAAAQKPVLATNYGLMGELTRRYQLGLDLDPSDPQEIARGLQYIGKYDPETLGDRAQMKRFAAQNSIHNFVTTIFKHI